MTTAKDDSSRDYRDTLFLPKTDFPMRAGLPKKEPEWLARWNDIGLYDRLREQSKGKPQYTLHDGPPYANGHIHMGTALNKILKDIVNRSHQMLGMDANYVPGWDCHGLPIEWKVEEEFRSKGRSKDEVSGPEFRTRCREYAAGWLDVQREEFKRLGVVGDWDNPYKTMNFQSEADICGELLKIAKTGQLYRGSKPIMWSPVEQTALAEAEVEYADRKATQIYVKFPVRELPVEAVIPAPNDSGNTHLHDLYMQEGLYGAGKGFSKIEVDNQSFDLSGGLSVVIWTTTPWTIPANRAVSFSDKVDYGFYKVIGHTETPGDFTPFAKVGEKLILAKKLVKNFEDKAFVKLEFIAPFKLTNGNEFDSAGDVKPRQFVSHSLATPLLDHPLKNMDGSEGKFDFAVPLIEGEHVTDDAGSGFVHTAPSHGEDDFNVWMDNSHLLNHLSTQKNNGITDVSVPMTLDDAGCYTNVMPARFLGLDVIRTSGKKRGQDGKANGEVLKALVECDNLLARGMLTLRDAHSWRSKAPVIRRATPQWFIAMDKKVQLVNKKTGNIVTRLVRDENYSKEWFQENFEYIPYEGGSLREKAKAAIEDTKFWPDRGRNRIGTMVADRPDWLISRQRNWGVPITLIVGPNGELHTERDDADAINARILAAVEKVGVDGWFETPLADFMPDNNAGWSKVTDILDVWFDSGSTHAFCLKRRPDLKDRADLYLEGSDQHRGWFQSSLLESCAVYGEAPYDGVLTHGFVVDEKGLKMSKSLGNTMSPEDISKQYGAEIMRIWTASSDWANDLKIGREIIQTNVDAYRKLRNTLRYMIGALDGYDEADAVDYANMPALEKWVLHRLAEITAEHEKAVRDHDHKKIFSTLFNFCTVDLSAFYFDIRKDALYCDPINSTRRRACRTVINEVFQRLTTWLAPIMCFTMEEVWQARHPSEDKSVHMELFRDAPEGWLNADLAAKIETVRDFRTQALETIEPLRRDKVIKSSLEASVTAPVEADLVSALTALDITRQETYANPAEPNDTLADYLIVSACTLSEKADGVSVSDLKEAGYSKCERSWKYFKGEGDITPRDKAAVEAFEQN